MTEQKGYLVEFYKKDINQDFSERVYKLLDYAEEILKTGFKNPGNKKLHEQLLTNFGTESQCVKRLITDDLFDMEYIPLHIKTTFQKDFAKYILNIRDWMKKSAHLEKIDLWERDRLGDIRDGLFEQWGGFAKTHNYRTDAECKSLETKIKILKAKADERQDFYSAAEALLSTGNLANKTKPETTQTEKNISTGTGGVVKQSLDNTDKGVESTDWDRQEDKTKVCKWIHKTWITKRKPLKAKIIREALNHFGLPEDYYNRVRKEYYQQQQKK